MNLVRAGRDDEIRRCVHILSRRTKNNPVLIGESGVGKVSPLSKFSCFLALEESSHSISDWLSNKQNASLRGD
ncbi:hypothetical protein DUNSADRAFT_13313 [Dunaliella salina]|uniref:Uncharacterized protein n=1 Tax=Dunaliella salina TaxID=3046 RepID=A0ABQ7G9M9_DUNSA|nr:hypothetical protein DUNSADRAFT_13313 [Dunaliella salina]|eukprot:KAF5831312.1 hypothetical protein DUNSADRAFT_13313 [Dunaliella salina]